MQKIFTTLNIYKIDILIYYFFLIKIQFVYCSIFEMVLLFL